jgi:hypothetical protein
MFFDNLNEILMFRGGRNVVRGLAFTIRLERICASLTQERGDGSPKIQISVVRAGPKRHSVVQSRPSRCCHRCANIPSAVDQDVHDSDNAGRNKVVVGV